jgi:hypothetical protein
MIVAGSAVFCRPVGCGRWHNLSSHDAVIPAWRQKSAHRGSTRAAPAFMIWCKQIKNKGDPND